MEERREEKFHQLPKILGRPLAESDPAPFNGKDRYNSALPYPVNPVRIFLWKKGHKLCASNNGEKRIVIRKGFYHHHRHKMTYLDLKQ